MTRVKIAELTSGTGALVLGVAIGAYLHNTLRPLAMVILIVGIIVHGWGMFDLRRVHQKANEPQPRWATALYWLCWLLLAVLAIAAVLQVR